MAQSSEIKLLKRFDQNVEITGTLTVGGNSVLTSVPSDFSVNTGTFSGRVKADTLELTSGTTHLTFTQSSADWFITNNYTGYNNGISIYNGTGGVNIVYDEAAIAEFDSDGVTFHENVTVNGTISATGYNNSDWDTAHGWGDHSVAGYLTSSDLDGTWVDNGYELGSSVDFNDLKSTGLYSQNSNSQAATAVNGPTSFAGILLVYTDPGNGLHTSQTYYRYGSNEVYQRYYYNGGWQSWTQLITGDNIGSQSVSYASSAGSAGDANTLDSLNSTSFLRSDASDTFTGGTLTISGTAPILSFVDTNSFTDANDRFQIRAASDVGQVNWYDNSAGTTTNLATFYPNGDLGVLGKITADGLEITGAGAENALTISGSSPTIAFKDETSSADDFYIHVNSNNFYILRDQGGIGTYGEWDSPHPLQLEADTGNAYIYGNTAITSGNISSQSVNYAAGADTVDGLHASSFLRTDTDSSTTGYLRVNGTYANTTGAILGTFDGSTATSTSFTAAGLILGSGGKTGWGPDDVFGAIRFYNTDSSGVGARDAAKIVAVCENGNGTTTTTFSGALAFYTSPYNALAEERLRITDSGEVGIGTTTPQAPLHIIAATSSNDALIQEWSYTSATQDRYSLMLKQTVTSGVVRYNFSMVNDNTAYNNVLVLDRGNIGIGTTAPSARLHISGDSITGGTAYVQNGMGTAGSFLASQIILDTTNTIDTTGWQGISFDTSTTAGYGWSIGANRRDNGRGSFRFYEHIDSDTGIERFTIAEGGNIGIGTDSPSGKFNSYINANRQIAHNALGGDFSVISDNNSSPVMYIKGTGTADLLQVFDNTSQVFTIEDGGNVGIGTTSPLSKLHVTGDGTYAGGITLRQGTNQAHYIYTSSQFQLNRIGSSAATWRWGQEGGSDFMTLNSTGLGIGTTSPSARLDVVGNGNAVLIRRSNGYASIKAGSENSGHLILDSDVGHVYLNNYVNKNVYIANGGGNVGIGTTSPAYKLDVSGSLRATSSIIAQASSYIDVAANQTDSAEVKIGVSSASTEGFVMTNNLGAGHIKQNTSIKMLTYTAAGTSVESARFTTTGVGIGTDSPVYPLDVTGRARITDDLFLGDVLYHDGDTNTYMRFSGDRIRFYAGGILMLDMIESTTDKILMPVDVSIARTEDPAYALDVGGTIRATGDVIAYSDARVKENVKTIDNALEKVTKLRGVEYNKIGETEQKIGVIAQEIEQILPQVVQEDKNGMKSVAYGNIVGVLIEAIKEQQKQIDELKKLINK